MRQYSSLSRRDIALSISRDHFEGADLTQVLRSMELAVSLWLTINVRSKDVSFGPLRGGENYIEWPDTISLCDLVRLPFQPSDYSPNVREARIDPGFTVANLQRICGIQIEWTSNLMDHLAYDASQSPRKWWQRWFSLSEPRGILYIYPHKVCLVNHLQHTAIYPPEFLYETLQTLDLLFRLGDRKSRAFLEERNQPFFRYYSARRSRALSLTDFNYWRENLVNLYDVFNAPPAGFHQMWHDRRNPMQWWTFWLAAFLVVSSIAFGIISTYITYKQLRFAALSWELSLLQACHQTDAISTLCPK